MLQPDYPQIKLTRQEDPLGFIQPCSDKKEAEQYTLWLIVSEQEFETITVEPYTFATGATWRVVVTHGRHDRTGGQDPTQGL